MKFKIKVLDIKNFSSFLFIGIICLLFIFQGCEKEKDDVLSAVEKEWLAHHKEIRIAPDPNFPPIEYFDTSGVYRGLIADYFVLIEKRLNLRFTVVRYKTWDEVLQAARNLEIDAITAAQITPERSKYLLYTHPIIDIPNVIITRSEVEGEIELENLEGKKVAITKGYALQEYISELFPGIKIVPVVNDLTALQDVSFKQVDATVVNLAVASYLIEKYGLANLRVAGDSRKTNQLAIASRKDEPMLNRILDKGLILIDESEKQDIYQKWIGAKSRIFIFSKGFWYYLIIGSVITFFVIAGFLVWNRLLSKQVRTKTLALSQELQEHLKDKEALIKSEELYHKLAVTVPDLILVTDLRGRITYTNDVGLRITGRSDLSELVGTSVFTFIDPRDIREVMGLTKKMLERPLGPQEFRFRNSEGVIIDFEVNGEILRQADGTPYGLVFICRDITDRKQAEEALRQTQKLESLGVLAGGVAHDFNNILQAILGHASLALKKLRSNMPIEQNLEKLQTAALRAKDLTQQLLAYSGRGKFQISLISLNDIIKENIHFFEVSIPKHIHIKQVLTNVPTFIEADSGQIQQIIMNLIINAADAIGEKNGTIIIHTTKEHMEEEAAASWSKMNIKVHPGEYNVLEVNDDGCGMSEETMEKIFDPFFTTKFTGRGLGLAAVLGIIRGHKAGLQVESILGKGTTFRIAFPAHEVQTIESISTGVVSEVPSGMILVIDDEESVREFVSDLLEVYDLKVLLAENGEEGLKLYNTHQQEIKLVLLDLSMPGMGGEEAFRKLREINPNVRIILSSGYSESEIAPHFAGKGLTGFIQKPYIPDALVEMIQKFG